MRKHSEDAPADRPRDRTHAKQIAVGRERCFLVRLISPADAVPGEDPLDEIALLLDTAGGLECGRLVQRRARPHAGTYLHKGKLAELVDAVLASGADTVLVDDDLAPPQLSAIENACQRKVIDRSELILDIFQSRARSHQAKMQVQLAQLQYELPRLARKWTHLERLGGGIGTRGPGESQIESDRRLLRAKIGQLRRDLDSLEERKVREVSSREPLFAACLVGYTNAGKSRLMNRLSHAETLVEDRLFATLDTLTRRIEGESGQPPFLLSDTVGFIRRLPHNLVASFHATLEEAAQANLLLHVTDASDPLATQHMEAVEDTLGQLGLHSHPRIHVLNKTDIAAPDRVAALREGLSLPSFAVSAQTGEGIDALTAHIRASAHAGRRRLTLRFPASDGRRYAFLNQLGVVQRVSWDGDWCLLEAILDQATLAKLESMEGTMTAMDS